MKTGKSVKTALRWMMLGKGTAQIVNWLVTIVVIRILTPADYGLLAMAMVLIAVAQILRDMGLQHALIQAKNVNSQSIRQVFTALQILGLALFAVIYAAAPLVAKGFGEEALIDIIRVLAVQFPLLALQGVPGAMLSRDMNFRTLSLVGTAASVVSSITTLTLALLGYGIWSLVIGSVTATVVRLGILTAISQIAYRPTSDFTGFRTMFSFGGFVMLSSCLHYVQNKSAHILIGGVLGKESLGIYTVSNRLATLPMQKIAGILNQVGFAAFSKIHDDMDAVRENFLRMQAILSFFAFPVFWGIASVTESLVPLVLGDKWLAAIFPLQVIALAAPLRMIFNTTTPALNGIGNSKLVFTNLLISASTMPFAYFIGMNWGVNGVAAVWIVFYPVLFFGLQYRSLRNLGIPFASFLGVIWKPLCISAGMLLLIQMIDKLLLPAEVPELIQLPLLVAVGGAYYVAASYYLNPRILKNSWKLIF